MASPKTVKAGDRSISVPTGLFINNEWVEAVGKTTFGIENPATGEEIIQIQEGRAEDVDIAVKKARALFNDSNFREINPMERGATLLRLADLMEEAKDDLIALEMLDTGKTYKQASALDIPASIGTLRYYAGWADKVLGLSSSNIPKVFSYTRREPVGVCGQIIPWNFPLLMFTWKIAPAFACGNTVVIKSAEATPLSALYMCDLIKKAGFPAGAINLISGYGKNAGAAIASHMGIDKVAFTGSTVTGRAILKAAASSNLKKVTLELGGKSPNIIFPDADIKRAVEWSIWGINAGTYSSRVNGTSSMDHGDVSSGPWLAASSAARSNMNFGQTCHAGTRIYVHEDVYDDFLAAYTKRLTKMKVGDNFDKSVDQGPQNSKMQYDKILGYIDSGKSEGAKVHLGGNAVKADKGGYFIEPTIFTDVTANMKIMKEEIFGPVVAIAKFKTEEEVIQMANDTTYGLAAGIHTKDYERAIRVTSALQAGTTWVNMFNFVHWSIPFGGYKESGIGRECGEAALENYTETKAVYFNMGMRAPDALDED